MKKTFLIKWLIVTVCIAIVSCSKPDPGGNNPTPNNPGGSVPVVPGTVASFERIPIPGVNPAGNVGVMPTQFYCTNIGPYVNVFNGNNKSNVVYKYRGGSGSDAWISYSADSWISSMIPSNMYNEGPDEMSYMWCSADATYDYQYGENNLGTGSPSFKYMLQGDIDDTQPYAFSNVFEPTQGLTKGWGIFWNEVWHERANSEDFELFYKIPAADGSDAQDGDNFLFNGFLDPDNSGILWCWGEKRIYKFDLDSKNINSWDLSSLGAGYATCVTKADGEIYIQYSNYVLRENGANLTVIGTLSLSLSQTSWATIASNGTILFAADGTYYDKSAGSWKSFIGDGKNLSASDLQSYNYLKELAKNGQPIAATQGGGPVYVLTGEEMIKIVPKF